MMVVAVDIQTDICTLWCLLVSALLDARLVEHGGMPLNWKKVDLD